MNYWQKQKIGRIKKLRAQATRKEAKANKLSREIIKSFLEEVQVKIREKFGLESKIDYGIPRCTEDSAFPLIIALIVIDTEKNAPVPEGLTDFSIEMKDEFYSISPYNDPAGDYVTSISFNGIDVSLLEPEELESLDSGDNSMSPKNS